MYLTQTKTLASLLLAAALSLNSAPAQEMNTTFAPRDTSAPAAPTAIAATAATTATPAAAALSIPDALAALSDEDAATRALGLDRLSHCTEQDIPALETASKDADLDIRAHATEILAKVRRGHVAVQVTFPDGTPAAHVTGHARLIALAPVKAQASKDADKEQEANFQRARKQLVANAVPALLNADFTTDAAGRCDLGAFTDGAYRLDLYATAGYPVQNQTTDIQLTCGAQPVAWTLKRGITATLDLVDEAGQPVADAWLLLDPIEQSQQNLERRLEQMPTSAVMQWTHAPQSDAKGGYQFEHIDADTFSIGALKTGCQPVFVRLPATADGGTCTLHLKLVKQPPVELKLTCLTAAARGLPAFVSGQPGSWEQPAAPTGHALAALRVLAVPTSELTPFLTNGMLTITHDQRDALIAKGAIDLGAADAAGEAKVKLLPDTYQLIGFSPEGEQMYFGNLSVSSRTTTLRIGFSTTNRIGVENQMIFNANANTKAEAKPDIKAAPAEKTKTPPAP